MLPLLGVLLPPLHAQTSTPDVGSADVEVTFFYPVKGQITERSCRRLRAAVDEVVENENIRHIVFEFDTPGGLVDPTQQTAHFIYELEKRGVKTIAYIPNGKQAISAGTILAFSCQRIVMGDNSHMGDVAPMSGLGGELGEKWQTVIRSILIRYAEERGYPLALVKAMVSKDIEVFEITLQGRDGVSRRREYVTGQELQNLRDDVSNRIVDSRPIVDEGELLTLHEQQALDFGFIEHIVDSNDRYMLLDLYDFPLEIRDAEEGGAAGALLSTQNIFLHLINHPFVKFLLIVAGILGFVMELKIPGLGLPGLVGLGCFLLYFVGGYYAGTVGWLEVTLFVLALAALAAEVFVFPGFGISGAVGLAFLFASLVLAMVPGSPLANFTELKTAVLVVVSGLGFSVIGVFTALHFLPKSSSFSRSGIVSHAALDGTATPVQKDESGQPIESGLLGKFGMVITALRPAGKIEVEREVLDVVAEGEFIDAGAEVEIAQVQGNRIVVRPRS